MDLHQRLEEIAGPPLPPTIQQLEADLTRGRRALRRRRAVQTVASAALAVAAMLVGFTFTRGAGAPDGRAVEVPAAAPGATPATELMEYAGEQPAGYTLKKVPSGYAVLSDDDGVVVLAPRDEQGPAPKVDPFRDRGYDRRVYAHKVRISVETTDDMSLGAGDGIKVAGRQGILTKGPTGMPDSDIGWSVWALEKDDSWLIVHFGDGFKLSRSEMIELAAGVTVSRNAKRNN